MNASHKVTLQELRTLARSALGDNLIDLTESQAHYSNTDRHWQWRCTVTSSIGAVSGAGSRMGARRQLRDLLRLLSNARAEVVRG